MRSLTVMRNKYGSSGQARGLNDGFTILELTVVLAVITAMLGAAIALASASLEGRSYNGTLAKMQKLQQALADYRIAFNRLPCPAANFVDPAASPLVPYTVTDANFGREATVTTNCGGGAIKADLSDATSAVGMVPVRTLGLPDDMAFDGWGRRIRYAVSPVYTASDAFDGATVTAGDATTRLTVKNNESGSAIATTAVFALVSYGKDGHGGRGAATGTLVNAGITNSNQLLNCKCTSSGAADGTSNFSTFVQGDPKPDSTNSLNNFDDIVLFSTRADLRDATE